MEIKERILTLIAGTLKENQFDHYQLYYKINEFCSINDDESNICIITWKSNSNIDTSNKEEHFEEMQDLFLKELETELDTLMDNNEWNKRRHSNPTYSHMHCWNDEISLKISDHAFTLIIYHSGQY